MFVKSYLISNAKIYLKKFKVSAKNMCKKFLNLEGLFAMYNVQCYQNYDDRVSA